MANDKNKIKHSDLFADDLMVKTIKDADLLLASVEELKKGFLELLKAGKEFMAALDFKKSKDIEAMVRKMAEMEKVVKGLEAVEKARVKVHKQKKDLTDAEIKQAEKAKILAKDRRDGLKAEVILESKLIGTLEKLEAASTKLRLERKKLNLETQAGRDRLKEINKELDANNHFIKENSDKLKQQKLNVGNYTASIREALHDTGLFNNGIGRLIMTLRNLKKQEEENEKSTSKLGTALKLTALGFGLAMLGAAVEFSKLSQAVIDFKDRAAASFKDLAVEGSPFMDFVNATIQARINVRELGLALQAVSLDEQDFNEIAADATIGFEARNNALLKAIELSKERGEISVKLAQQELDLVNKEITAREAVVGVGNATNDLLDKRQAATLALNEAIDVQGDLERQNAQREREQNVARATAEIDLILKKKQSANAQKVILEQQLADEKNQLEQRRVIAKKLLNVNNQTTAEEIAIFKKYVKVQFNENELLKEQDAVRLKQRLEAIRTLDGDGLGEAAISELAKIIKQAQEDQITNIKTINDLKEEEIRRTQKIASIEREIARANLEDQIGDIDKQRSQLSIKNDTLSEEINKGNNVFDKGLMDKRAGNNDQDKALADNKIELQRNLLNEQADNDKKAAKESINDEKIRAEEINKINNKLSIDLANLDDEQQIERMATQARILKEDEAFAQKRRNIIVDNAQQIGNIVNDALDRESEKKQAALDKETSLREKNIDKQQALAERGLENTQAFEEKKAAEAELKKEEQKEKDVRRAKIFAYWNALTEFARKDPNTAPLKALAQIAVGEFIASAISAFDGTEDTGGPGNLDNKGGKAFILHPHEGVVTRRGNEANPGLVGAINEGRVEDWFKETYMPKLSLAMPVGAEFGGGKAASADIKTLMVLGEKLDTVANVIRNKPEYSVAWAGHNEMVTKKIENGMQTTIRHMLRKPRI